MGRVDTTAAIALGANLGDRRAHLNFAVERLSALLKGVRVSAFIESEPVDVSEPQPPYLNGMLVGETPLSARELLDELLAIERACGRTRLSPKAPRTLDLDLVLYGDAVIDDDDLLVPHPRFRERAFVIDPLAEIAPELIDPVTGKSIKQLQQAMAGSTDAAPRDYFPHGRLAYVQIPAIDTKVSAKFYADNFSWQIRGSGTSHLGFSDATGDIIGAFVTVNAPSATLGIAIYIYVHGIDAALAKIAATGGRVVREPYREGDIWAATFTDPAGNIAGIWQKEPRER